MNRMFQGTFSLAFPWHCPPASPPPRHILPLLPSLDARLGVRAPWYNLVFSLTAVPESFSLTAPLGDLTVSGWCQLPKFGDGNNTGKVISFRNSVNSQEPECALKTRPGAAPRELTDLVPLLRRSVPRERGRGSGPPAELPLVPIWVEDPPRF